MTIEVRQVSGFDRVRLQGPGILKIRQSNKASLTVHAPRYAIKGLQSRVVSGELLLGLLSTPVVSLQLHREVISYDLQVKDLSRLQLTGVARAIVPDLDTDSLTLVVGGSARIRVEKLTADHLDVRINNRGQVSVSGDVEAQSVRVSSQGDYQAGQLISDFAELSVADQGQAIITVNEALNVAIAGNGSVTYVGYPDVQQVISGPGRLQRIKATRK
ncbi:MAG: hypothetical protein ACI8PP_002179 [Candidatus Pseudothioglobus sp.]